MTQAELRSILTQWDKGDLAPLTQNQQNSWMDLAPAVDERPFPDFPGEDEAVDVNNGNQASGLQSQSQEGLGQFNGQPKPTADSLSLEKIETSQQFFKWFGAIEAEMEEEQESSFKQYHGLLTKYSKRCAEVLQEIESANRYLKTIEEQHLSASTKTNALHTACEQLVKEQTDLVSFNESINERLVYFTELDGLTQKMNSPTLSVLNDQFIPMLGRIDECINYVNQHQNYKEAPLYLARFQQCQNRAMSLVKIHVVNTLRAATKNVSMQVQKANNDHNEQSFTLFYGKFRMHAPRIKMLMKEIDRRAEHNADFAALLQDCYQCYYDQRTALLGEPLNKTMDAILSGNSGDLPGFVRGGCAHMVRVCCNEHQLYQHFFHTVDQGLDDFLEGLATILYDICRPLFIHTESIDTLVELCSVLRVEALDNKGEQVAAFASVAEQMLQDVQQRLCYRTQSYISSSVASYTASAKELDYPAILAEHSKGNGESKSEGGSEGSPLFHPTWFPTVSRSLVLLSKLYRSVQKMTFQALAQELMHACLESLVTAETIISSKSSKTHGQLFLIMHLLVLREQIAPFDVEFTKTEKYLDFAGFLDSLKGAATDLIAAQQSKGIFGDGGAAIFSFLQRTTPRMLETKEDSRLDLESKLKEVCMEFMQSYSRAMIAPLQSFMVKVDALSESAKTDLRNQSFSSPEKVHTLVAEATGQMRTQVATARSTLTVYLDDKTVNVLLDQIQSNAISVYDKFHTTIMENYTDDDDLNIIGLPSSEFVKLSMSENTPAPMSNEEKVQPTPQMESGRANVVSSSSADSRSISLIQEQAEQIPVEQPTTAIEVVEVAEAVDLGEALEIAED